MLANLSDLTSQGIAAYQSRGIVVAVGALRPHRFNAGYWLVVLLAAPTGQHLTAIQQVSVQGATRTAALIAAKERAQAVAAKLGAGTSPGPARAPHLTVVREAAPAYAADPAACDTLTHVHIQELGMSALEGFELELTGAGYDGTVEVVGPREAALWLLCNELSHALLVITPEREAQAHRELVALLRARRQPATATTATLRHAA